MSLDTQSVKKIAHLARLAINEDQVVALQKDLQNILNMVQKIDNENTQSIDPLDHPIDEHQPLRDDLVTEQDEREHLLKNSPQAEAGLFIVPQFIESE